MRILIFLVVSCSTIKPSNEDITKYCDAKYYTSQNMDVLNLAYKNKFRSEPPACGRYENYCELCTE